MIGYRECEWVKMKESVSIAVYMLMRGTHCRQTRFKRKVPAGIRMTDANARRTQPSERRSEEEMSVEGRQEEMERERKSKKRKAERKRSDEEEIR